MSFWPRQLVQVADEQISDRKKRLWLPLRRMSGRFVRGAEGGGGDGGGLSNPDSTLTCPLCQSRMQVKIFRWLRLSSFTLNQFQDARVLPGCLHSYCKACLDTHSCGAATFPCPGKNGDQKNRLTEQNRAQNLSSSSILHPARLTNSRLPACQQLLLLHRLPRPGRSHRHPLNLLQQLTTSVHSTFPPAWHLSQ